MCRADNALRRRTASAAVPGPEPVRPPSGGRGSARQSRASLSNHIPKRRGCSPQGPSPGNISRPTGPTQVWRHEKNRIRSASGVCRTPACPAFSRRGDWTRRGRMCRQRQPAWNGRTAASGRCRKLSCFPGIASALEPPPECRAFHRSGPRHRLVRLQTPRAPAAKIAGTPDTSGSPGLQGACGREKRVVMISTDQGQRHMTMPKPDHLHYRRGLPFGKRYASSRRHLRLRSVPPPSRCRSMS